MIHPSAVAGLKKTRRGQIAAGFMSFVAQVGVMVRSRNFVFLIGIIQMKNGMTLASGLLVMSKTRISFAHVAGAAAFAGVISLASVGFAQSDKKKPFSTSAATEQASGAASSTKTKRKTRKTVFRPKETIAPGKSVSFPPDI